MCMQPSIKKSFRDHCMNCSLVMNSWNTPANCLNLEWALYQATRYIKFSENAATDHIKDSSETLSIFGYKYLFVCLKQMAFSLFPALEFILVSVILWPCLFYVYIWVQFLFLLDRYTLFTYISNSSRCWHYRNKC